MRRGRGKRRKRRMGTGGERKDYDDEGRNLAKSRGRKEHKGSSNRRTRTRNTRSRRRSSRNGSNRSSRSRRERKRTPR